MAKNQIIAEFEQEIAGLENELALLDKEAVEIAKKKDHTKTEIFNLRLAIKKLKGTAGESSSSETPLNDPDVAVSSPHQIQPHAYAAGQSSSSPAVAVSSPLQVQPNASAAVTSLAAGARYKVDSQCLSVDLIPRIGNLGSVPPLTLDRLGIEEYRNKIRCLEFLSCNTDGFVTCGYDGVIVKWQLKSDTEATNVFSFDARIRGSGPECLAINPMDDSLVLAYGLKETLMVVSLTGEGQGSLKEVPEQPHQTGLTQVAFLKCQMNSYPVFVSSGRKNHEIASWRMLDGNWKTVNKYQEHSNIVTGICGIFNSAIVASAGRDKRALVYDLEHSKKLKQVMTDTECSGIAANPRDYNLLCIQTSDDEKQLKFWDLRTKDLIHNHEFGWKKSTAKKETSLIKPVWSPSGLLLSCGTAEEMVCIFDIRYCRSSNPSMTLSEHEGKVFKVAWAPTRSVLLTSSLDRKIRLHSLVGSVLARRTLV